MASSGVTWGKTAFVRSYHLPLLLNTSTIRFRCLDEKKLNMKYLNYFLNSEYFKTQINRLITGSAQPNFGPSHLAKVKLIVPPLETQRKIVAILEKAEATQRLRAEADALTDELVQSVFLEMFGDPVTNPMEWDKKKICDVCTTSTGGTPKRDHQEYYNGNIPWLKSGELKNSFISNSEEFISEEGLRNSSAKIVSKDTLLFALYGATVGKVGILKFDSAINQAICAISPRKDVTSNFLYYLLKISRKDLLRFRTGGAQPNLSQTILREYKIVLPPLPLQKKFEEITTMIQNSAEQQKISQIELGSLDENILSKAFTGELIT